MWCSAFVTQCNRLNIVENEAILSVIDSWGVRMCAFNKSGTIIFFDAVCMGLPFIIILHKQIQGILSSIRIRNKNGDCHYIWY